MKNSTVTNVESDVTCVMDQVVTTTGSLPQVAPE